MSDFAVDPRLPPGLPREGPGCVATVGTFDGVHRGHWAVLQRVRRLGEAEGRRTVLVTFDPHPLRIVRPEYAPRLLTTPVEKKEILAESGLEYAVFVPFTPALARYTAERFVREILLERLRVARLVIGYDHGLGRGRTGDAETLRAIGRRLNFDVEVVPAIDLDGAPVSSTRVRRSLEAGDVDAAAGALGRPYSLRGVVVRGDGRGRALGFPTANIRVPGPDKLLPREGIYAVNALLREPRRPARTLALQGVLHLGPRPMFQGSPPSIELHLFDFDQDIYGSEVRVDFCARLRDIHHFGSIPALVRAIEGDCEAARRVFREGGGACAVREEPLD